jgi:murein DD-endopeptidase MepM/ murein hydrolase activator NlpD
MILELAVVFCLQAPVPGRVVAPFAPVGRYEGHWGLDLEAGYGSPVRAGGGGVVTFAGSVAGMRSVTIDHGGGLRSSVSYLSEILVETGMRVAPGALIAKSGMAHGEAALHFSVRIDGEYVDPLAHLLCGAGEPGRLYLLPPPNRSPARYRWTSGKARGSYPRRRAQRPTWGHLRPSPSRPSSGRGGGLPPARARSDHLHTGRLALAEGRSRS